MSLEIMVEHGEAIGYGLVGVLALLGLGVIQLLRRRADRKRARLAVRLVSHSISALRPGPIAVRGAYRESTTERWLECEGHHVAFDGDVTVVRGTRGRWRGGARTYTVRDRAEVIAIGVMAKRDANAWSLAASPGESGVQLFAVEPAAAPAPLWPWRALLGLATCGAIAYGGLYWLGTYLVDDPHPCGEVWRLQLAAGLPQARDAALAELARCKR